MLIRSNHGIVPTEAGLVLYRHAQLLLKQLEQAQTDVGESDRTLAGRVSIGLATYSASSTLSLPILKAMKAKHPRIVVHINDSFGNVLSELTMTGRMDMAIIYSAGPIKGVALEPLFREELYVVSRPGAPFDLAEGEALPVAALAETPLILPSDRHFLRRLVEESFGRARVSPRIVAEIESVPALAEAVMGGLGATILPASVARGNPSFAGASIRRLVRPAIEATVWLCVSDHLPLSEPALAVRAVVLDIVGDLMKSAPDGIHAVKPA